MQGIPLVLNITLYDASCSSVISGYNTKDTADRIYNSESPTLLPTLTGDTTSGFTPPTDDKSIIFMIFR